MISETQFYKEENFKVVEADGFKFEVPKDWEVVKLGDVATIAMGQSPPSKTYNEEGEGLPFLQGKAEFGGIYPNPVLYCSNPIKIAEKGDILISVRAPVGDVNIAPYKLCIGRGLASIRFSDIVADSEFYFYYFQHIKPYIENLGKGSTFKAITKNDLDNLKIPLPPLQEQQKIAHVLMSIDKAIEAVDEAIKQAERIKKGLMQELLTKGIGHKEFKDTEIGRIPEEWGVVRLGDVAELESGGTPSRQKPEYWENGTIPWVKSGELNDGIIYDTEEKITELGLKHSSAKIFPKMTLLIALYGATVGKTALLGIDASTNQAVCAIFPRSPNVVDTRFLQYDLIFQRNRLISQSSGGAQPNIYLYVLRDFKIPLPPFPEQQKIAEILSKWDEVIELKKAKKERLERMKKKAMKLLLTGKVRVK